MAESDITPTAEASHGKASSVQKELSIKWHLPDTLPTLFANEVAVQNSHTEFILSFFEVRVPFLIGLPEEEQQAHLESISSLEAVCVARVAIPVQRIPALVGALQNRFNSLVEATQETREAATQEPSDAK